MNARYEQNVYLFGISSNRLLTQHNAVLIWPLDSRPHTFSLFSPSSVEPWNQARIHAFKRPVVAGTDEYLHYSVPMMTEFSRMGGNYHLFLCAFTHCWIVRFVLKVTCFSHLRNKALKFQTCSGIVSFTLQFKPSETTLNCQDNLFKCFFCT